MSHLSHPSNFAIVIAVCTSLWLDAPGMTNAFGPDTIATRILTRVYLAILLASLCALIRAERAAHRVEHLFRGVACENHL
jgi:hypothetical protein